MATSKSSTKVKNMYKTKPKIKSNHLWSHRNCACVAAHWATFTDGILRDIETPRIQCHCTLLHQASRYHLDTYFRWHQSTTHFVICSKKKKKKNWKRIDFGNSPSKTKAKNQMKIKTNSLKIEKEIRRHVNGNRVREHNKLTNLFDRKLHEFCRAQIICNHWLISRWSTNLLHDTRPRKFKAFKEQHAKPHRIAWAL